VQLSQSHLTVPVSAEALADFRFTLTPPSSSHKGKRTAILGVRLAGLENSLQRDKLLFALALSATGRLSIETDGFGPAQKKQRGYRTTAMDAPKDGRYSVSYDASSGGVLIVNGRVIGRTHLSPGDRPLEAVFGVENPGELGGLEGWHLQLENGPSPAPPPPPPDPGPNPPPTGAARALELLGDAQGLIERAMAELRHPR
jgi:hypothetical protein